MEPTLNNELKQVKDQYLGHPDKALLALNWTELSSNGHGKPLQMDVAASLLHSETSDKGSKDLVQQQDHVNDVSKKLKMQPKWKERVRIYSENGLEGPYDDGYRSSWRKYGQNGIFGAKYPRSFYRCKNMKLCRAKKQVQRSDDDPTVFEITYKGKHTCVADCNPNVVEIQPDKEGQKQTCNAKDFTQTQADDILLNLKDNLRANTEELSNKERSSHLPFH